MRGTGGVWDGQVIQRHGACVHRPTPSRHAALSHTPIKARTHIRATTPLPANFSSSSLAFGSWSSGKRMCATCTTRSALEARAAILEDDGRPVLKGAIRVEWRCSLPKERCTACASISEKDKSYRGGAIAI